MVALVYSIRCTSLGKWWVGLHDTPGLRRQGCSGGWSKSAPSTFTLVVHSMQPARQGSRRSNSVLHLTAGPASQCSTGCRPRSDPSPAASPLERKLAMATETRDVGPGLALFHGFARKTSGSPPLLPRDPAGPGGTRSDGARRQRLVKTVGSGPDVRGMNARGGWLYKCPRPPRHPGPVSSQLTTPEQHHSLP